MPETTNGLPYPPGDVSPNVPYWNQQLAEAIDPFVGDTGWIECPILAGFQAGFRPPSVRRIGSVVYMAGFMDNVGFVVDTEHEVMTIPAGFTPPSNRTMTGSTASPDKPTLIRIRDGGLTMRTTELSGFYALDSLTWTVN